MVLQAVQTAIYNAGISPVTHSVLSHGAGTYLERRADTAADDKVGREAYYYANVTARTMHFVTDLFHAFSTNIALTSVANLVGKGQQLLTFKNSAIAFTAFVVADELSQYGPNSIKKGLHGVRHHMGTINRVAMVGQTVVGAAALYASFSWMGLFSVTVLAGSTAYSALTGDTPPSPSDDQTVTGN